MNTMLSNYRGSFKLRDVELGSATYRYGRADARQVSVRYDLIRGDEDDHTWSTVRGFIDELHDEDEAGLYVGRRDVLKAMSEALHRPVRWSAMMKVFIFSDRDRAVLTFEAVVDK